MSVVLLITNIITLVCLCFLVIYYKIPEKLFFIITRPRYSRTRFLNRINHNGKLLDVGCGNNSPYIIKTRRPDIMYTGIDIAEHNQSKPNLADNYIIAEPERFSDAILNIKGPFDAVISAHNLEHCNDREKTLDAMIKVLKTGGLLYLSFPTEGSVDFPSREGTLNYYDDKTHKDKPPDYDKVLALLRANNIEIIFSSKSYKPFFYYLIGFFSEWKSRRDKRVDPSTWAFYGFETIIWGKKKDTHVSG